MSNHDQYREQQHRNSYIFGFAYIHLYTSNHLFKIKLRNPVFTDRGLVSFLARFVVKLNVSQCNYDNVMVLIVLVIGEQ